MQPLPALSDARHEFVDTSGLRMHVAEFGDRDAPVVVLLHGWPQHWYAWRHVARTLASDHRVLCPDLRGFGWSEAPRRGYDAGALAGDVLELLDLMGVGSCTVAGHDWGGIVGLAMCDAEPTRIDRLVAASCAHPWARPSPAQLANAAARLTPYQTLIATPIVGPRFVRRVMLPFTEHVARRSGAWTDQDAEIYRAQFDDRDRVRASVLLYRTWLLRGMWSVLQRRSSDTGGVPILCLHGDGDPVIPTGLVTSGVEQTEGLSVEVIPDVGHFLPEECPDLVAARVAGI